MKWKQGRRRSMMSESGKARRAEDEKPFFFRVSRFCVFHLLFIVFHSLFLFVLGTVFRPHRACSERGDSMGMQRRRAEDGSMKRRAAEEKEGRGGKTQGRPNPIISAEKRRDTLRISGEAFETGGTRLLKRGPRLFWKGSARRPNRRALNRKGIAGIRSCRDVR